MTVSAWLTRRQLRRRGWTLVPVVLVVVVGGAGALLALEAADRTASAYGRYLDRAAVGDVEINPSFGSAEIDEVIRKLPGVEHASTSTLLWTAIGDQGIPVHHSEMSADEGFEGVFGSTDGRYVTMDRPAYRQGRPPTGPSEAVVSTELADQRGFEVGDTVSVSFWNVFDDLDALYFGEDPLLEPLGVEELTIVGVVTFPNEVLPDELYPRGQMVVSADIADRYDCWLHEPPPDATLEETIAMLDGCSVLYRYWSLAVTGGKRSAEAVQEAFIRASGERNANLPAGMVEVDARYILISTTTDAEVQRVARAVRPTVAGLRVLGMTVAVSTVLVGGLAIARALRQYRGNLLQWWQLGLGPGTTTLVTVVPLVGALVVGALGATALAWLLSPFGPVGSVRAIEPSPERGLGLRVVLLAVAVLVLLGLVTLVRGWRAARSAGEATNRHPDQVTNPGVVVPTSVPTTVGLRGALGTGRGAALLSAGVASASPSWWPR
jgi:hypothetical protein